MPDVTCECMTEPDPFDPAGPEKVLQHSGRCPDNPDYDNADVTYCDNCGEPLAPGTESWIAELVVPVNSANAGESAVLCGDCSLDYHFAGMWTTRGDR
jgi:hypothetical protein